MLVEAPPNQTQLSGDPIEAVPIREISRLTGINTVTLRAWERRYGLLKPQRTQKGHRLYSMEDVTRVKEIQTWLGRGLAIGKVNAILSAQSPELHDTANDSAWPVLQQQLDKIIGQFNRHQLERALEELSSLYPPEMLADELFLPLITALKGDEASKPARLAFFKTVLAEHLYVMQYRQRQQATGMKILILSGAASELPIFPLLLNYGLVINNLRAEFLHYLERQEALVVAEALDIDLLVICGYESLDASELQRYLNTWYEKTTTPICLVGRIAQLYSAMHGDAYQYVSAYASQQDAMVHIKNWAQVTKIS